MSQGASSQLKKMLELLDSGSPVDEVKRLLREAIAAFDRQPVEDVSGSTRGRGRTYFDRLIQNMLDQVKRAESREALINDTLRALGENPETRAGSCYLVLEGFVRPSGEIIDMSVTACEAVHPQRLQNFVRDHLPRLSESTLVRTVLIDREAWEFLPTSVLQGVSYFGEFDPLVTTSRRGIWICALPLPPADAQHPSRMLVVIYPVAGTDDAPALPRGAMQEWRTLTFLRAAYEMLNHQLASTSELVAQQRREILADLGPGLVNHEINQQLKVIDESSNLINWAVRRLEQHVPLEERAFDTVVDGLANVLNAVKRLHSIADAFNNLERRPTSTPVKMAHLIDEVTTLINHKIAQSGAKLTCEGDVEVTIITDSSLVEHVFINIIANALEEIESEAGKFIELPHIHIVFRAANQWITIDFLNNGPPITLSRPERIFEKGFTTKPRGLGHGLGLYLCRIIMTYLGGGIELIGAEGMLAGFNVGFRLELPVEREGSDDIATSASAGTTIKRE